MVVKVKYDNNADNGVVRWLHQLPEDRQYVDIRTKDMSKYGGPKDVPVNYGRGFIIEDESDPLLIEFKKKFPNTNYYMTKISLASDHYEKIVNGFISDYSREVSANQRVYKKWFDNNVPLADDILENNAYLYEMYNFVSRQKYEDDTVRSEAVNVLKNLIESNNDELMEYFLTVTEDFFTRGKEPLMEKYHLNHHFTYYYITIRDKSWPKGIDFGWYPLGLKRLKESKTLILSFRFGGNQLMEVPEQILNELGYSFDNNSHTYRKVIIVPKDEKGHETFFGLSEKLQGEFLNRCYHEFVAPIIKAFCPKKD